MKIWVDADACPKIIKEILYRAANRTKITLILVANQPLSIPPSEYIKKIQVASGFDVADNYIAKSMEPNDLVITADIPLANSVIENKGFALNPRGELYTASNIKERFAMRNLREQLRDTGMIRGGPASLNKKDVQIFANSLDKFLVMRNK